MFKRIDSIEAKRVENPRGGQGWMVSKEIFGGYDFGSSITHFMYVTIPPGSSVGFHEHSGDEEAYFILEGEGKVCDDERVYDVMPSDTVLTTSGHSHSIENTGQQDLKLLAVIAKSQ